MWVFCPIRKDVRTPTDSTEWNRWVAKGLRHNGPFHEPHGWPIVVQVVSAGNPGEAQHLLPSVLEWATLLIGLSARLPYTVS